MAKNYGTRVRRYRTIHCAQCDETADVAFVRSTSQSNERGEVLDEFVCYDGHTTLLQGLIVKPLRDSKVFFDR